VFSGGGCDKLAEHGGIPSLSDEPKEGVVTGPNAWYGRTSQGIDWHVYLGNASQVLAAFNDKSFHCVVTSPPYYNLRDYNVEGQIGVEETVQEYVNAIAEVMDQVYRVLKQDGVLFLNIGDTYYSGKGEAQGKDRKSKKRRFGLRPVDKSGGVGIGIRPKNDTGADTVEHFLPKDRHPQQAYEWINYRLVCATLNSRKKTHEDILDPFHIKNGWFTIDFPSLFIKPAKGLNEDLAQRIQLTIDILRLNDESTCWQSRERYIKVYCLRQITFDHLLSEAPFIAFELIRQNLVESIREIMAYSSI